jgi:hypothetical protein
MIKTHLFDGVSVCLDMQKLSKSGGSKTRCNLIGSSTADWYLVQLKKQEPVASTAVCPSWRWCSKETLGKSLR